MSNSENTEKSFVIRYERKAGDQGYWNGCCGGDLIANAEEFSTLEAAKLANETHIGGAGVIVDFDSEMELIVAEGNEEIPMSGKSRAEAIAEIDPSIFKHPAK